MELTGDDVQDILRLLDDLPYGELQLETTRFRLLLRRAADGGWTQQTEVLAGSAAPAAEPAPLAAPLAAALAEGSPAALDGAAAALPDATAALPAAEDTGGLIDVRAPLLGTFYRAPRPGAPPFVTLGSHVSPDTVVCIIETMKLMNSVTAGARGTVAAILLDNAQFADQGAVLMRIRELP